MKLFLFSILVFLSLISLISNQNCANYSDLVAIPFNSSAMPCSYSGFAFADTQNLSALYYWYFPASNGNSENAPLIVWLGCQLGSQKIYSSKLFTFRKFEFISIIRGKWSITPCN